MSSFPTTWIASMEHSPWRIARSAVNRTSESAPNLIPTSELGQAFEGFGACFNETEGDLALDHFTLEHDPQALIPYTPSALNRRHDLRPVASPWSPPGWMKFPRAHNYGSLIWTPESLKSYALYLSMFVTEYRKLGLENCQLHVQNEVVADQKFASCVWTCEQLREFIGAYLGPRLKVSNQWAGKATAARTRASWPELPLRQSENACGDGNNSWGFALSVLKHILHFLQPGARVLRLTGAGGGASLALLEPHFVHTFVLGAF